MKMGLALFERDARTKTMNFCHDSVFNLRNTKSLDKLKLRLAYLNLHHNEVIGTHNTAKFRRFNRSQKNILLRKNKPLMVGQRLSHRFNEVDTRNGGVTRKVPPKYRCICSETHF